MRWVIGLLLGLGIAGGANALATATYTESLTGLCQRSDSAKGFLDSVPEALSLDMVFSHFSGNCQFVGSLLLNGSTQPSIDLNMSVSAESISASLAASGSGGGHIDYTFQVVGPADTSVELNVSATVSISGSRLGMSSLTHASGSGQVSGLPGGFGISISGGPPTGAEQTLDYTLFVPANFPFNISMNGTGSVSAYGSVLEVTERSELQVVVDPVFSFVNPGDASLYSLEFSPNMAAVPNPPMVALFSAGLVVVAGWARRRRKFLTRI